MAAKLEIVAPAGEKTITTRRVLNASRELCFDAWTKPELVRRWLGPRALEMVVCDIDLRVGGSWRFVHRLPTGQEMGFHGVYREITRPERLVTTSIFDMMEGNEAIETLTLEDLGDGRTRATTFTVHASVEARDMHVSEGRMEAGMTEGFSRLDELLAELKRTA